MPEFPEYYSQLHDRKVVNDAKDIKSIMSFSIAFSIVKNLIVVVPVMVITLIVIRRRRKRKATQAADNSSKGDKQ